jgi:hypothetical protein
MVVLSENREYFSYLDMDCSLGVYQGNVHMFMDQIMAGVMNPDLDELNIKTLFRTPSAPDLQGRCFLALNRVGYLRIYQLPTGWMSSSYQYIWQSDKSDDEEEERSFFHNYDRYYVELSDHGALSVQRLRRGQRDADCIWSTTSCHHHYAILYRFQRVFRDFIFNLRHNFDPITHLEEVLDGINRFFKNLGHHLEITLKRSKFFKRIKSYRKILQSYWKSIFDEKSTRRRSRRNI